MPPQVPSLLPQPPPAAPKTPGLQTLAQLIRAKHPGAYDDLDDVALEQMVKTKFPGVYDDLPTSTKATTPLSTAAKPGNWLDAVGETLTGIWKKQPIHPIDMAVGTAEAIRHPIDTISAIGQAQTVPLGRAEEKFKAGDYAGGVIEAINYLLPVIGPQISDLNARQASGQVSPAGFVGESIGLGAQAALPGAIRNIPTGQGPRITPVSRNPNPTTQAAVEFGQREGIPVDAATATGNRAIRGVQFASDRSLGGAGFAKHADVAQGQAFTDVGRRLAAEARPAGAVSPFQAGESVLAGVKASQQRYGKEADTAYEALRAIEADPKMTQRVTMPIKTTARDGTVITERVTMDMQMPVDIKLAKAQIKPIYDRMTRQMPIAQQQANSGLVAMKNILDAPDYLPASMVDMDLSALKALNRGDTGVGHGLSTAAVRTLETELQKAIAKGGKPAQDALAAGRAATKQKVGAEGLLEKLKTEPRQVFDQAIAPRDSNIQRLLEMARESPKAMAQVGRAYLDDLIDTATQRGGFNRADGIVASWDKLGPQTKSVLFPDAQHRANLDHFFNLMKAMNDNPNPSGTSYVIGMTPHGLGLMLMEPITGATSVISGAAISRALHSQAGVRALTQGLRVPTGNKAAAATAFSSVAQALGMSQDKR